MLRHRLDNGWTHHQQAQDTVDPATGNTRRGKTRTTSVRAALQRNEMMNENDELSAYDANDTRILILRSPVTVEETDWFTSPHGEVWQAVSEGMKRHRPGSGFKYTAVIVRRAEERDT